MKNVMQYYRITGTLVGHLHKNYKVDEKLRKEEADLGRYQKKRGRYLWVISQSSTCSKLEAYCLEIADREEDSVVTGWL